MSVDIPDALLVFADVPEALLVSGDVEPLVEPLDGLVVELAVHPIALAKAPASCWRTLPRAGMAPTALEKLLIAGHAAVSEKLPPPEDDPDADEQPSACSNWLTLLATAEPTAGSMPLALPKSWARVHNGLLEPPPKAIAAGCGIGRGFDWPVGANCAPKPLVNDVPVDATGAAPADGTATTAVPTEITAGTTSNHTPLLRLIREPFIFSAFSPGEPHEHFSLRTIRSSCTLPV